MVRRALAGAVLAAALAGAAAAPARADALRLRYVLAPGLELERYDVDTRRGSDDGEVHVVRIDPVLWHLRVAAAGNDAGRRRRLHHWGREQGWEAAINAGMYQADGRTHVGFCQVDGEVLNPSPNDYLSAFVCDPRDPELPVFSIVDLDEVPLARLRRDYGTVVQNLRLIKHHRENRWSPTRDRWREAALAQDEDGRALFVLCTRPLTMHAFNELLLALPLEIVAAQHLEGNAAAGLWVRLLPSGYGAGLAPSGTVPLALGVAPRTPPAGEGETE